MFHKSQSVIKSEDRSPNMQRIALRQVRKPKILRSPANYTKKKFTPRINSSFAEYDEIYSPKARFRSTSVDRPRRASESGMNSTMAYNTYENHSQSIFVLAKKEMQEGKFEEAAEKFSQILLMGESVEAMYNRAICNISQKKIKEAIVDLLNIIKENSTYSKSAYLQIALCFQSTNEIEPALRYITQAINRFSRFDEAFLIRAKLYKTKKNWEKARADYRKFLKHNPNDEEAILGIVETYEKAAEFLSALKFLNEVVATPNILFKKAKLFFALNNFEQAVLTIDKLLVSVPSAEAYFLKAESHFKLSQFTEAGLSYEQCLKYDLDSDLTPKSVCNLGAIKIREKDFYGALHTFQRCMKNKLREQKILEIYSEAVISLMKREYKEGIKVFNKLLKSKEPVIEQYIGNCYCYRAYGYLALSMYEKSLRSLKKALNYQSLDKASLYNQELAFALMHASRLDFLKSNQRLTNAMKLFQRKSEPYVYKASFLIYSAYKDDPFRFSDVIEAEHLIELAVSLRDPDSELLFYRAIIRYLRSNFQEALEDMKQSIEKAEDNISEHYILRGLCFASLKMYKDAIQDFAIALQLNEKNHQVYAYRGRCAYLVDDSSLAFNDFQKFVMHNKNDPEVHTQAAILLMSAGSYDDALKALENSLALQYSSKANYLIAKSYIIQNDPAGAIAELKKLLKNEKNINAQTDLEILYFVQNFLPSPESFLLGLEFWAKWAEENCGEIFTMKYVLWFKAVFCMFIGKFSQALDDFQAILEILHSKDSKLMSPDETLTSEEENCEILYNISLCHLFGKKSQSILILEDLSEILNNKHKGQMLLLVAVIHLTLNNNSAAEKVLKEAFHCDPETVTPFLAKCPIKLLPLNTGSAFADKFPLISLDIPNQPKIEVRPAISLPRISLPSLDFTVQNEVKDFFYFKKILPKPEAPWLNRIKGSIQFTEVIVDVDTEPTELSERDKQKDTNKEENEESFEEVKRTIKSMAPLRHFSSEKQKKNIENVEKNDTPQDIVRKIQEMCSRE